MSVNLRGFKWELILLRIQLLVLLETSHVLYEELRNVANYESKTILLIFKINK